MVLFNFVGWGGDARAEKKNVRKDGGSGYRIERGQRQAATTRNTITNTSRNTNTNTNTSTNKNANTNARGQLIVSWPVALVS